MEEKTRLFFALWPDTTVSAELRDLQAQLPLKGRLSPAANFHITLAFIGDADPTFAACLEQAAADVKTDEFVVGLDQIGYFKKPRIVWVGPTEAPAALQRLHRDLGQVLSRCGFDADPDPRFRPHVTLARKALPVEHKTLESAQAEPVVWPVTDFVLVESHLTDTGSIYRIRRRYPLQSHS